MPRSLVYAVLVPRRTGRASKALSRVAAAVAVGPGAFLRTDGSHLLVTPCHSVTIDE
jgi:hypothetical protein